MTYVIGWKSKTSVFISGDTALTHPTEYPNNDQFQGILEPAQMNSNVQTTGALKVKTLNSKLIAGFSGLQSSALEFIGCLRKLLSRKSDYYLSFVKECILDALPMVEDSEQNYYILGFLDNGAPRLLIYRPDTGIEEVNYAHIGSGKNSEWHRTTFEGILNSTVDESYLTGFQYPVEEKDKLIIVNSLISAAILHKPLIHLGVGGIFLGMWIDTAGAHWQSDTRQLTYKITDGVLSNSINGIASYTSNGITLIQAPTGDITLMADFHYAYQGISDGQLLAELNTHMARWLFFVESRPIKYEYTILYCQEVPLITILRTDNSIKESALMNFTDPHDLGKPIEYLTQFQKVYLEYGDFNTLLNGGGIRPIYQYVRDAPLRGQKGYITHD